MTTDVAGSGSGFAMIVLAAAMRIAGKGSELNAFHGLLLVHPHPSPPSCVRRSALGMASMTSSLPAPQGAASGVHGTPVSPATSSPLQQPLTPHRRCLTDLCCPRLVLKGQRLGPDGWVDASPGQSCWCIKKPFCMFLGCPKRNHTSSSAGNQARNTPWHPLFV